MPNPLPTVTVDLVEEYGRRFDKAAKTIEEALARLLAWCPRNLDISEILLKVTTINSLYSTNIYSLLAVAEQITQVSEGNRLDDLLDAGDPEAVELVARVRYNGETKDRHNYSFASKYCSWHNPSAYPIYDSRARTTLWAYKRQDSFCDFSSDEIWCYYGYRRFREIVAEFRRHYELESLSYKSLDKFLYWFDPKNSSPAAPLNLNEETNPAAIDRPLARLASPLFAKPTSSE